MITDGFEAAAIRRRVWLGLWETSWRITFGPSATLEEDRAHHAAIEAHSNYVAAGLHLKAGKLDGARCGLTCARKLWTPELEAEGGFTSRAGRAGSRTRR